LSRCGDGRAAAIRAFFEVRELETQREAPSSDSNLGDSQKLIKSKGGRTGRWKVNGAGTTRHRVVAGTEGLAGPAALGFLGFWGFWKGLWYLAICLLPFIISSTRAHEPRRPTSPIIPQKVRSKAQSTAPKNLHLHGPQLVQSVPFTHPPQFVCAAAHHGLVMHFRAVESPPQIQIQTHRDSYHGPYHVVLAGPTNSNSLSLMREEHAWILVGGRASPPRLPTPPPRVSDSSSQVAASLEAQRACLTFCC
jgi:hypothetical protein